MEVVHADGISGSLPTEFIRRSVSEWCLDARPGQDRGESTRVVIAAFGALLECRHAAKLCAQYDQGLFEEPALLEVADQRCGGLVKDRTVDVVVGLELFVAIPIPFSLAHCVCAIEELNEADSAFNEASCEQTVTSEARFQHVRVIGTVQLADVQGL